MSATDTAAALAKTKLTASQQIQILMDKGISREEAQVAVATAAHSASNVTAKGTTTGLTVATKGLKTAISGLWSTLMANPIALVIAGIAALGGVIVGAVEVATTSFDEALESVDKASSELNETSNELENTKSQLTSIEEQITAVQNKGALSLSDKAELQNLQAEEPYLKQVEFQV